MAVQWRRFQFFNENILVDGESQTDSSPKEFTSNGKDSNSELLRLQSLDEDGLVNQQLPEQTISEQLKYLRDTCADAGQNLIALGDTNGRIHVFDRKLRMHRFDAFDGPVTALCLTQERPLLFAAGEVNKLQQVRVWHVETGDDGQIFSRIVKTINLSNNRSSVTSMVVEETVQLLVTGHKNGQITIVQGDLLRSRALKLKSIPIVSHNAILGLFIRPLYRNVSVMTAVQSITERLKKLSSKPPPSKDFLLFVVSKNDIHSVRICPNNEIVNELENQFGCDMFQQATLMGDGADSQLALGRPDGLFFYQADGRGPCLAVDGFKRFLTSHKRFLAVVSEDIDEKMSKDPNMIIDSNVSKSTVSIYDVHHRFVAFFGNFDKIRRIFSVWGSIVLLCQNGLVIELREQDSNTQLELLFRKSQFALAAELASKHLELDPNALVNLYREYGDHLLKSGDIDGAVTQYIRTIGGLEPSYVIDRLLSIQKLSQLATYLDQLHRTHNASCQHTELLISCLTRLGKKDQLSLLLQTSTALPEATEATNLNDDDDNEVVIKPKTQFDVVNAVNELEQSGFPELALQMAEQHEYFELAIRIALDNLKDSGKAIETLKKAFQSCESSSFSNQNIIHLINRYGRRLLALNPEQTFVFIQNLCNQWISKQPKLTESKEILMDETYQSFNPSTFIDVFVNDAKFKRQFLRFLIDQHPKYVDMSVYDALLELDLKALRSTDKKSSEYVALRNSIIKLLSDNNCVDLARAVGLCQTSGLRDVALLCYERMELYELLLLEYANQPQPDLFNMYQVCKKFGYQQPALWIWAFRLLLRMKFDCDKFENDLDLDLSSELAFDHELGPVKFSVEQVLIRVIKHILSEKLLSLSIVIQSIAENETIPFVALRSHTQNRFMKDVHIFNEQKALVNEYQQDTDRTCQLLKDIKSKPFSLQASKCAFCNSPLELPAVHFLCMHAFHKHCFDSHSGQHDQTCPKCLPEQERRQRLLDASARHDRHALQRQFVQHLQESQSAPISVVARFLGQRIFD